MLNDCSTAFQIASQDLQWHIVRYAVAAAYYSVLFIAVASAQGSVVIVESCSNTVS